VIESFEVRTRQRSEFVDITHHVQSVIQKSGVDEGTCIVFVPHTTAAVTINENADPDVIRDILSHLSKVIPADPGFHHSEGNSDAHIKSSLLGQSELLLVRGGRAVLGTWQGVFFAEFDGPRTRSVHVRVSGEG
jgi:secondary thiamine-phosphate synthase enzyme